MSQNTKPVCTSPAQVPLPAANTNYPHSYLNAPQMNYNYMHNNYANFSSYPQQAYSNWNGYQQQPMQPQQQAANFYPNYYQYPPCYPNRYQDFGQQSNGSNNMNLNNNNNNRPHYQKNNNNHNNNYKNNNFPKNNNNNHNKNKQQSPKVNKQDLPDNNQFYCEVCDRGFKTSQLYDDHCATHTTCGVNGCKFTAAAKLVKIHFNNFHASGIDKKIPKLDTEDDIKKYINDRKKNFPTNTNVEKKAQITNEKIERGVQLETRQFGRFNKSRNSHRESNENSKPNENVDKNELNEDKTTMKSTLNKRIKKNKNKCLNSKAKVMNRKPTLLQQLLANEIRHERNILLQCVKYVVDNNFFEQTTNNKNNNTELAGDVNTNNETQNNSS